MPKKITEQEYSEYEKILKKYQRLRRGIIKAHKNISEALGNNRRLPQLVAPEREKKVSLGQFRITGRRVFNAKLRRLKKVVAGGYQEFYKDFKTQYLELYRRLMPDDPELNPFHKGKGFLYSPEQMKGESKEVKRFMEDYNKIVRMNPVVFAYLVKTGRIPSFNHLYNQFHGTVSVKEDFLGQFSKAIKLAKTMSVNEAGRILTGRAIMDTLNKSNKTKLSKRLKSA